MSGGGGGGTPEALAACANAPLCHVVAAPDMLDARSGRCLSCGLLYGQTLAFQPPSATVDCAVCLADSLAHVRLAGCTHTLCVECARTVLADRLARCPLCRAGATLDAGAPPALRYSCVLALDQ
jgi:Zinc finger, C3HC4 type (RING finger)